MSNLLKRYEQRFTNSLTEESKSSLPEEKDKFLRYRQALEEDTNLEVTFDYADTNGDLSLKDSNGITVCLRGEDLKKTNQYYAEWKKANFIGIALHVKIIRIDVKKKVVYVKRADSERGAAMSEICKELKKGNHPVLSGTVLFVRDNNVIVNILNLNIIGVIKAREWRPTFVRVLSKVVNKGDVVKFAVTDISNREKGHDISFVCSRREIMQSPWETIEDIPVDSVMTVQCIEKPKDKLYFWGTSTRVPEIDVMCDLNPNLNILTNVYYKCKVRTFDREARKLQVVPFAVVPVGVGTVENINFLTKKRKKKEV